MSWITIPNEVVLSFTGKPLKSQALNNDLDYVFKPIKCPAAGCAFTTTLLREFQAHLQDEHEDDRDLDARAEPEMVERNVAWVILEMLLAFNRQDSQQSPNLLRRVQRPNDAHHSNELWRRAWNCREHPEIKLKKEQYDWLHQLLDRKLPLAADPKEAKERREQGEEPQTVGMVLFSLSEDSVRQAFTTLPERRKRDVEEEAEAVEK